MIKLREYWTERPIFLDKESIESIEPKNVEEDIGCQKTSIRTKSGNMFDVRESVGSIMEMDNKD